MSNALVLPESIRAAQEKFDEGFKNIASDFTFLSRLQLFTSNSEECKKGLIDVATYGLYKGKDTLVKLAKTVLCMPLAHRSKAVDTKAEKPKSYYVQKSPEFQEIMRRSNADSNSGCMYGPEFLIWLPDHGFVTFLMGSKTARNAAGSVRVCIGKVVVLGATYIQTASYSWHGPTCEPSMQGLGEMPPADRLEGVIVDFLNPKEPVEAAPAPADGTESVVR